MQKPACPGAQGAGEAGQFLPHKNPPGKKILHLSFLPSFFFVFQSETGGQGRDLSRDWPRTQDPRSPRTWRFNLAHELCPPAIQDQGGKSDQNNDGCHALEGNLELQMPRRRLLGYPWVRHSLCFLLQVLPTRLCPSPWQESLVFPTLCPSHGTRWVEQR